MAILRTASRWLTLLAALLLLNAALTFHNVWPTLAIRLASPLPEVSAEFAVIVLLLAGWALWRGAPAARLPAVLAGAWLLFTLARYAEVTAPALYGRPVNLYWDLRHVGGVLAMMATAAGTWVTLATVAAATLALVCAFVVFRLAWGRLGAALARRGERTALTGLAAAVTLAWLAGLAGAAPAPSTLRFSIPVTASYGRQLRLVAHAVVDGSMATARAASAGTTGRTASPDSPAPSLRALGGDDVVLVFLESYGAITYSQPRLVARLAASRLRLAQAIERTGRGVVTAQVTAPTFGGNSWLSHLTLLSGAEVADPDAYARDMQGAPHTLVQDFARRGYRTVALMPGLRQAWPEGAFYDFDSIVGAAALEYRGPEFGWWRIPDQYALARLDAMPRDARPRFVFFTTISSHAPFRPTPPYQPDWSRLQGSTPFDADADAALAVQPEWTNLGPAYGDTIAYAHDWLAGYLERHAADDLTLIVLGDHQPAAAVSGEGASWAVPVHVVSRRAEVLRALQRSGFLPGLQPPAGQVGRMRDLRGQLSAAFSIDAPRVDVAGLAGQRSVGQAAP